MRCQNVIALSKIRFSITYHVLKMKLRGYNNIYRTYSTIYFVWTRHCRADVTSWSSLLLFIHTKINRGTRVITLK